MSEDHPFRREIHDEIHARPIVLVGLPSRVRRLVFQQPGPGKVTSAFEAFRHFCETEGLAPPQPYSRQHKETDRDPNAATQPLRWIRFACRYCSPSRDG